MGQEIAIKTQQVINTATVIGTHNSNITYALEPVESAIQAMRTEWSSPAGERAAECFYTISNMYKDTRPKVIQNYINYLCQQVGEGYEETETTNTSLADAFK